MAIERAKQVFGARYVNVQPHCASFANHSVMQSLLRPGETILGMSLDQGGHLTHGAEVNLSGRLFKAHTYGVDDEGVIDYRQLGDLARAHRPRLIVCGTTSYTRLIDFDRVRAIADDVGAYVLADVTHIAGLVAAGLHPSPIDAAHFTTTCTFKQLYGPRGRLIMMGRDADALSDDGVRTLAQRVQSAVFPLLQGSPEVHTIAAKARALGRLLDPAFGDLARRIRANADALARSLAGRGYEIVGGGTDNHIVLFRVPGGLTGATAERALELCDILVNKNKIPGRHPRGLDDERGPAARRWAHPAGPGARAGDRLRPGAVPRLPPALRAALRGRADGVHGNEGGLIDEWPLSSVSHHLQALPEGPQKWMTAGV
ncbi:serine hydroxymethyltransferase [Nonomuraea bangladeshensis]